MKTLFLSLFLIATAGIQTDDGANFGGRFEGIVQKSVLRLEYALQKRPFKLKSWNNSLEKMALAARMIMGGGDPDSIVAYLREARQFYEGNSFSFILEAMVAGARGRYEEADALFESFLLRSRSFTDFEEAFLHWGEFHMLRRAVYRMLEERGISFEGREEEIQVAPPAYQDFIRYIMNPGRDDWLLNVFFVVMIIGGGVLLIISSLSGVEFTTSPFGTVVILYLVIWIAYGLWLFDLAFGLPLGWDRRVIIPSFFIISFVGLVSGEIVSYIKEKRRPLEKGYRRCPHCKAIIVELAVECSECRKKI